MSILFSPERLSRHQKAKLDGFPATREACLIVFVLAGASGSRGKTLREIQRDTARLTGGRYEGHEGLCQLRLARLYLSRNGYLKCAPRMSATSGRSASAFTKVPFRLSRAWRRSRLAEEQAADQAKATLEDRFPSGPQPKSDLRALLPGRRFVQRLTSLLG